MTQHIKFIKTDKDNVAIGKLYAINKTDRGGHLFFDDAGELRYASNNDFYNRFGVVDVANT